MVNFLLYSPALELSKNQIDSSTNIYMFTYKSDRFLFSKKII